MINSYENVVDRVSLFIHSKGLNKSQLASKLGMLQPTVNGYFIKEGKSKRTMTIEFLLAVIDLFPEINTEWLFKGEGTMERTQLQDGIWSIIDENTRLKMENKEIKSKYELANKNNEALARLLADNS